MSGRVLGLDIGDSRIGIALSDPGQRIASPHSVYERVGYGPDTRFFVKLAQDTQAVYLVAGLPYNMDGSLGPQAQKVKALGDQLTKAGLDLRYIDERLTTKSAQQALISGGMRRQERKGTVDKVAAALILQSWLDSQANGQIPGASRDLYSAQGRINFQEDKPMDEHKKDQSSNEIPETEVIQDEYDEDSNIVELTDEDGVTTAFEYQATIEYEGDEYIVLMAPEEDDEEDEEGGVVIMKIEQDEKGEDIYVSLEDEEKLQAVFDLFLEQLDEEEEGEAEDEE